MAKILLSKKFSKTIYSVARGGSQLRFPLFLHKNGPSLQTSKKRSGRKRGQHHVVYGKKSSR